LPDPAAALAAIAATRFVVSLELRPSAVTDRADVVFPVAAVAEKAGTFVNWEGRGGSFGAALSVPAVVSDLEVLGSIADAMDVHLGLPDPAAARAELAELGTWRGTPAWVPGVSTARGIGGREASPPKAGTAVLATWHELLDAGRMQDGEPHLAGTARRARALMSEVTAAEAGVTDGGKVTVATANGTVTVGVEVADMPDRVVWLPANAAGCAVRRELGAGHGTQVTLHSQEGPPSENPPGGGSQE
jgi:NADH-quinone oxidoreductase subunit G